MAPDERLDPSYPDMSYPSLRDSMFQTGSQWLKGKAIDDGAEGLWRIHNGLYDFSQFAKFHPGGRDWILTTKGTDVTEAFESHHLRKYPSILIQRYFIRNATTKRHSPFTFEEDGFYLTLKRRIAEDWKKLPEELKNRSKRTIEGLVLATFALSYVACISENVLLWGLLSILAGLFMAWTIVAGHNFLHQRDNWRMYLSNFSFIPSREMRITHALSHHLFPNTLLDYEITSYEPFFYWLPKKTKSTFFRYAPWIYAPVVYAFVLDFHIIRLVAEAFAAGTIKTFRLEDLVPLSLPLFLWAATGESSEVVLSTWVLVWHSASFWFILIGLNAAHHHPDIFHDGDEPCKDRDWGLHQLQAVMDRIDVNSSQFAVLTNFGEHGLHHLFPSLDHAFLPHLRNIFLETCLEFRTELRMTTQMDLLLGQFKQLARNESKCKSDTR